MTYKGTRQQCVDYNEAVRAHLDTPYQWADIHTDGSDYYIKANPQVSSEMELVDPPSEQVIENARSVAHSISEHEKVRLSRKLARLVAEDEQELSVLTDTQALNRMKDFPHYKIGHDYSVDDRFYFDGQLYRVLQDHKSQADWLPDEAVSLYDPITISNGYEVWSQPTGGHNAYNIGDRVIYEGDVYESEINGNTTVPDSDPRWWTLID